MNFQADIDIDFADRNQILDIIKHIPARLETDSRVQKHNSGVYVTNIPYDPFNDCAAIDYKNAEERGYFKIDFLNVHVYSLIRDNGHYAEMLSIDPPWDRLWNDSEWASQVVHIGNYTELLQEMKPDSIERMAAFISIIRPGKAHLQKQSWENVFAEVWDGDQSRGYTFKKSHAISYSMLVKMHMNLLNEIS